jgi:NAD kinase
MTAAKRSAWGRIGLVVNPHAGRGEEAATEVIRGLLEQLADEQVSVVEGTLESRMMCTFGVSGTIVPSSEKPELDARAAADLLLRAGADSIIGVGGDGTLCDIAAAIIAAGGEARLLGIGVGSANVGPLISLSERNADGLSLAEVYELPIHGVDAYLSDELVGTAFNDVVFANTFFGTRGRRRIDLDASAKLAGDDRAAEPKSVCAPETWIAKNGLRMLTGGENAFAQIIASPLTEAAVYAGKAISGLMCWGPYVGNHGVLAASSAVMVRTKLTAADVVGVEPLRISHVSFGVEDRIEIGGLRDGAVLVIDGNPLRRLDPSDVVVLRLRLDAIRALRPGTCVQAPSFPAEEER